MMMKKVGLDEALFTSWHSVFIWRQNLRQLGGVAVVWSHCQEKRVALNHCLVALMNKYTNKQCKLFSINSAVRRRNMPIFPNIEFGIWTKQPFWQRRNKNVVERRKWEARWRPPALLHMLPLLLTAIKVDTSLWDVHQPKTPWSSVLSPPNALSI